MVFPHFHVAHNVLAHHDGVVNENADGQRQSQQGHRVERETERPHRNEAGQHRHRQRQPGNHRRAPRVEKQEHHQHRKHRPFNQGTLHVGHRVFHARALVFHHFEIRAGRERGAQLVHTLNHRIRHGGGAVTFRLFDFEAHRVAAVEQGERTQLLRAIDGRGHITQANDASALLGHHQLHEVLWPLESSAQPDRALVKRPIETTHRNGQVALLNRGHNLRHAHPGGLHALRIEIHRELALHRTRYRHIGHTGNGAQLAGDCRIGQHGELRRTQGVRPHRQRDNRAVGIVELPDDRFFEFLRQILSLRGNGVADFLRGLLQVFREHKLHAHQGKAVAGLAVDGLDARDRLNGLLDGLQHLALNLLG